MNDTRTTTINPRCNGTKHNEHWQQRANANHNQHLCATICSTCQCNVQSRPSMRSFLRLTCSPCRDTSCCCFSSIASRSSSCSCSCLWCEAWVESVTPNTKQHRNQTKSQRTEPALTLWSLINNKNNNNNSPPTLFAAPMQFLEAPRVLRPRPFSLQ